jgi:hypothetical protein
LKRFSVVAESALLNILNMTLTHLNMFTLQTMDGRVWALTAIGSGNAHNARPG